MRKRDAERHKKNKRLPYAAVMLGLAGVLLALVIGSVALGRYPIGLRELGGILAAGICDIEPFWTDMQESLLLNHRLPRIILACLVGCCLSAAGVAYQGVFQNPMAAPDILGASSGAALGAALAILLDMGGYMVMLAAFVGSLLTVGLVICTGGRARGKRSLGLILSGIMIGSLVSSGTSFIKLVADPGDQLPEITYWLMGSLNGTSPQDVLFAIVPMSVGLVLLLLLRWRINILTLGEDEAQTMGVNAKRLRLGVIVCATLITAASVAVSGVIGWVGLVIPHLTRLLVGNDYRRLLPAAMLFGASFLLAVDDIARNLLATEIPIGILTSLLGAPLFIMLMVRGGERI